MKTVKEMFFSYTPEDYKNKYTFKKGLIKLGWVPELIGHVMREIHAPL